MGFKKFEEQKLTIDQVCEELKTLLRAQMNNYNMFGELPGTPKSMRRYRQDKSLHDKNLYECTMNLVQNLQAWEDEINKQKEAIIDKLHATLLSSSGLDAAQIASKLGGILKEQQRNISSDKNHTLKLIQANVNKGIDDWLHRRIFYYDKNNFDAMSRRLDKATKLLNEKMSFLLENTDFYREDIEQHPWIQEIIQQAKTSNTKQSVLKDYAKQLLKTTSDQPSKSSADKAQKHAKKK